MPAAVLATVASFQVVMFGENQVAPLHVVVQVFHQGGLRIGWFLLGHAVRRVLCQLISCQFPFFLL